MTKGFTARSAMLFEIWIGMDFNEWIYRWVLGGNVEVRTEAFPIKKNTEGPKFQTTDQFPPNQNGGEGILLQYFTKSN